MATLKEAVLEDIGKLAQETLERTMENIIMELPNGKASSIAEDLKVEKVSDTEFNIVITSPVWEWLDAGTGIYNPEHAGQGPMGEIVPIHAKALHFKNAVLAAILGFPTVDVFLKKVKGIPPRYFFSRHLEGNRWDETLERV